MHPGKYNCYKPQGNTESYTDETEIYDSVESYFDETELYDDNLSMSHDQIGGDSSNLIILGGAASRLFWPNEQPINTNILLVDSDNLSMKENKLIINYLNELNDNNVFFNYEFDIFLESVGKDIIPMYDKTLIISYTIGIDYNLLTKLDMNAMYFNLGHFGEGIDMKKASGMFRMAEREWKLLRIVAIESNKLKLKIDTMMDNSDYNRNHFVSAANDLIELKKNVREYMINDFVLNLQINYIENNIKDIGELVNLAIRFFIRHKVNYEKDQNNKYTIPQNLSSYGLEKLLNSVSDDSVFKNNFFSYYKTYNSLNPNISIEKHSTILTGILKEMTK